MTAEMAVRPPQSTSRFEQREVIETIKQTVCKGATDAQLRMFLEVCKATGLDPFLKEIWYVAEKGIIMAGRDGYLRVANEHPQFDGIETRVERDNNKVPIKAVCTVWRKDRTHPTICEAYYSEYKKGSPVWTQYPSAMIGKVAEVLALKRSFAINGVVSEEEIGNEVPRGHGSGPLPGRDVTAVQEDGKTKFITTPQAIAERKIAEMSAGKSYAEVSEEMPEPDAEQPADEALASQFKARLEQFAIMRAKVGDETYYRILGLHGFTHANEIKSVDTARVIYRELKEAYGDMQAARPVV